MMLAATLPARSRLPWLIVPALLALHAAILLLIHPFEAIRTWQSGPPII